jgi:hypothetical protein
MANVVNETNSRDEGCVSWKVVTVTMCGVSRVVSLAALD